MESRFPRVTSVVSHWEAWHELAKRLKVAKLNFLIAPYIRFEGELGEQATMFIEDLSGNGLSSSRSNVPKRYFLLRNDLSSPSPHPLYVTNLAA